MIRGRATALKRGMLLLALAFGAALLGFLLGLKVSGERSYRQFLSNEAADLVVLERILLVQSRGATAEDITWMTSIIGSKEQLFTFPEVQKHIQGDKVILKLLNDARELRRQREAGMAGSLGGTQRGWRDSR